MGGRNIRIQPGWPNKLKQVCECAIVDAFCFLWRGQETDSGSDDR